jgi:hypothetical protein
MPHNVNVLMNKVGCFGGLTRSPYYHVMVGKYSLNK